MRQSAPHTNRLVRICPSITAMVPGNCRCRGPFWSISRESFAWPLSILTSHAVLTHPSSLHDSKSYRVQSEKSRCMHSFAHHHHGEAMAGSTRGLVMNLDWRYEPIGVVLRHHPVGWQAAVGHAEKGKKEFFMKAVHII